MVIQSYPHPAHTKRSFRAIRSGSTVLTTVIGPAGTSSNRNTYQIIDNACVSILESVHHYVRDYGYKIARYDVADLDPNLLPRRNKIGRFYLDRWHAQIRAALASPTKNWVLFPRLYTTAPLIPSSGFILGVLPFLPHYSNATTDIAIAPVADIELLRLAHDNFYDLGTIHPRDDQILELAAAVITPNPTHLNLPATMETLRRLATHQASHQTNP